MHSLSEYYTWRSECHAQSKREGEFDDDEVEVTHSWRRAVRVQQQIELLRGRAKYHGIELVGSLFLHL